MKRFQAVVVRCAVALSAALSAAVVLIPGTPASAGTGTACSGNGCNNLFADSSYSSTDPEHHECNASAYTVLPGSGGQVSTTVGLLELRWGPYCLTNWGRVNATNNAQFRVYVVREDGLRSNYGFGLNDTGQFVAGPQLYTNTAKAKACADRWISGGINQWVPVGCTASL